MDPYQPPASSLTPEDKAPRHRAAYLMLGLAAAHAFWLASVLHRHAGLLAKGALYSMNILATLLGCLLLYVAAGRFALNCTHGTYLFFLSAVWSGAAMLSRGWHPSANAPFMAGLALALLGWWLVRRCSATLLSAEPTG